MWTYPEAADEGEVAADEGFGVEGEDDWVMECESVGVGVVFILFLFFFFLRSEALLSYTRKQAAVKKKDRLFPSRGVFAYGLPALSCRSQAR